jgi:hypothetical protein
MCGSSLGEAGCTTHALRGTDLEARPRGQRGTYSSNVEPSGWLWDECYRLRDEPLVNHTRFTIIFQFKERIPLQVLRTSTEIRRERTVAHILPQFRTVLLSGCILHLRTVCG